MSQDSVLFVTSFIGFGALSGALTNETLTEGVLAHGGVGMLCYCRIGIFTKSCGVDIIAILIVVGDIIEGRIWKLRSTPSEFQPQLSIVERDIMLPELEEFFL